MRITYDPSVNAAYIYLQDRIAPGEAAKVYPCDPLAIDGMINLDFDKAGRLIGIEVLDAIHKLPLDLLERAECLPPERSAQSPPRQEA